MSEPRIVVPPVEDYPALIALSQRRQPELAPSDHNFPVMVPVFQPDVVVRAAVDEEGETLGWGWIAALDVFPTGWTFLNVVVAPEHEGRGIGSLVHRALLAETPEGTTQFRGALREETARTHEVATHWGFEVQQRSVASRLALDDPQPPDLPDDVSVDAGLDWADPDAVEQMLKASQTNPEAAHHVVDLAEVRNSQTKVPLPICLVARVDGTPAGIVYGGVPDGTLLIFYAGVDPAFRGRGLALLLKQQAHVVAAAVGATQVLTQNEENNTGIRRINAELGFRQLYVEHRLFRPA